MGSRILKPKNMFNIKPMYKFLLLLTIFSIVAGCATPAEEQGGIKLEDEQKTNYVDVKYRDDDINLGDSTFEPLNTTKSSFVDGAWYDANNDYMIISLDDTYYHYCGIPNTAWSDFKLAESFGGYYSKYIKGNYDCRNGLVPDY